MATATRPGPFARKPTEHLVREASGDDGLKRVLQRRGVAISGDVRAPLRGLTADEERAIDAAVDALMNAPV